jgi:hypothetical protein
VADHGGPAEPAGRMPDAAGTSNGNPWKNGWRSLFLLGVTIALVMLGIAFRQAAAPGKEDPVLEASTPQVIGVFSTDPNATIRLTADVFWHDVSGGGVRVPFEQLYVSAVVRDRGKSQSLLVTSSLKPAFGQDFRRAMFYDGNNPSRILDSHEYVVTIPLDVMQHFPAGPHGFSVATFELPQVTQESNGSFFAHLPLMGINAGASYNIPYFFSVRDSSGQSENMLEYPRLKNAQNYPLHGYATSDPSKYQAPPDRQLATAYWQPSSLTTTEILEDVRSELENAAVNSIVPSDGHLQDFSYVWQESGSLEPTMNLTNQDTAASHSEWDFRSGIAFGVAAGTAVAFVQEENNPLLGVLGRFLSFRWLRKRPKIKSKSSAAQKTGRYPTGLGWPQ